MDIAGYIPLDEAVEYKLAKNEKIWWKFKHASWGDTASRERFLSNEERHYLPGGGVIVKDEVPEGGIIAFELWVTFGGTSIEGFVEDMALTDFEAILQQLPVELVVELGNYNRESVNVQWHPGWRGKQGE